jgi:hypothetical protein
MTFKGRRKYGKLKEEALDSTLWWTRWERRYGSVARHTRWWWWWWWWWLKVARKGRNPCWVRLEVSWLLWRCNSVSCDVGLPTLTWVLSRYLRFRVSHIYNGNGVWWTRGSSNLMMEAIGFLYQTIWRYIPAVFTSVLYLRCLRVKPGQSCVLFCLRDSKLCVTAVGYVTVKPALRFNPIPNLSPLSP